MKRIDLLSTIKEVGVRNDSLHSVIEQTILKTEAVGDRELMRKCVGLFVMKLRQKYDMHGRHFDRLVMKEQSWLSADILSTPNPITKAVVTEMEVDKGGRPAKDFEDMSDRTVRRKVAKLKEENKTHTLAAAVVSRSKKSPGMRELGAVFKKSIENPTKVRKSIDTKEPGPFHFSTFVELNKLINPKKIQSQFSLKFGPFH